MKQMILLEISLKWTQLYNYKILLIPFKWHYNYLKYLIPFINNMEISIHEILWTKGVLKDLSSTNDTFSSKYRNEVLNRTLPEDRVPPGASYPAVDVVWQAADWHPLICPLLHLPGCYGDVPHPLVLCWSVHWNTFTGFFPYECICAIANNHFYYPVICKLFFWIHSLVFKLPKKHQNIQFTMA